MNPASCQHKQKHKRITFKSIPVLCFMSILLLTIALSNSQASINNSFYYFYPDSTQTNLAQLRNEVDRFFKKFNYSIRFQAFLHVKDFNQQISLSKPAFLFIPDWYYQKNKSSLGLKPILRPQRKGSASYKKVLITRKQSVVTIDNLANHSLAMTAEGDTKSSVLGTLLSGYTNSLPEDINIIHTAKDTDALFAVALGQVDVALVAKTTLNALAKINKRLTQNINILAESDPISLPVLCYIDGSTNNGNIKKLRTIILDGHGQSTLNEMFQIDGWADVD